MAKTQEELNTLKVEYETLNNKLKELTEEELNIVTGGSFTAFICDIRCNLNPDTCSAKKATGHCLKEGI